MKNAFRSVGSLSLAFAISMLIVVSGCENPGAIGDGVSDTDADVAIDTISVDAISASSYDWYSGDYTYFSAGRVEDPFFGTVSATGMIKPALPSGDNTVEDNVTILMRLIADGSQVYGDSLSAQEYEIYEIEENWRGRAWMLQDEVQLADNSIGSFEMGDDEDSLDVQLSADWVDSYRSFSQGSDSAYAYEDHGLALVPSGSGKIMAIDSRSTRFVIQNEEADTFSVSPTQWAYSLSRSDASPIPDNSVPLHSTLESVITTDLNLEDKDMSGIGISRAELVLYENVEALGDMQRSRTTNALLYLNDPEGAPENIGLGNPVAQGSYSSEDNSFRFNTTSIVQNILANGMPEGEQFFIMLPNQGIVKSTLIYAEQAPADKAPKLIITSIKSSDS